MREKIHPQYFPNAQVICACGNTWTTGSTQEVIRTDVCSNCHPFFTGEQRIVDTAGQVDRFMRRLQQAEQRAAQARVQQKAEEAARKAAAQARARGERPDKVKAVAEKAAGDILAESLVESVETGTTESGDLLITAEQFDEIVAEVNGDLIVEEIDVTSSEIVGEDFTETVEETVVEVATSDMTEIVDEIVTTLSEGDVTTTVDETVTMITKDDVTEITDETVTTISDGQTTLIVDEIAGQEIDESA